ncbi:mitotic fidelity of chromosome transmission- protein [Coemansia erecta]|uniref:Mitotic fidelity of chromosome transmission-protein n=1 Tax=Coemansia erecta TaxID=147472 RepID=A0A9W7XSX9_9FUNG|nr:mitotic fidelity of chromosome transmission- protein [Coemansia erecta]
MSNRSARRTKSPATRNKFSEVGVAGRKTGLRVAGQVPVDEDGLENVAEFYKHTSPVAPEPSKAVSTTTTLHTLVSPTPIRSTAQYGTLLGALDMPFENGEDEQEDDDVVDEAVATPVKTRLLRAQEGSPTRAGRRVTMGARVGQEWVMSAKKGRRATMALMAVERRAAGEELDFGVEQEQDEAVPQEDDGFSIEEAEAEEDEPERFEETMQEDVVEEEPNEPDHVEEEQPEFDDGGFRLDDAEPEDVEEEEEVAEEAVADEPDHDGDEGAVAEEEPPSPPRPQKKTQRPPPKQTEAVRRSTRATVPPVAYWRNEHVEYSYEPTDGQVAVPVVKNVVRVRQTAEEKQQAKKRRTKRAQLPSLRGIGRNELDAGSRQGPFYYYDDEHYGFPVDSSGRYGPRYTEQPRARSGKRSLDEADDNDDIAVDERPKRVLAPGGAEEMREIALSRQSIQWANIDAKKDRFKVGVGLLVERDDGEVHASSGVLSIAVGGRKPPRNAGPRALFYLVTSGQVEVRVHGAAFRVGVLGQFLVPTHNTYSISNVGTHPAQLFYVHVCPPEQPAEEEEAATNGTNGAAEDATGDGEESAGDSEIE